MGGLPETVMNAEARRMPLEPSGMASGCARVKPIELAVSGSNSLKSAPQDFNLIIITNLATEIISTMST